MLVLYTFTTLKPFPVIPYLKPLGNPLKTLPLYRLWLVGELHKIGALPYPMAETSATLS